MLCISAVFKGPTSKGRGGRGKGKGRGREGVRRAPFRVGIGPQKC